MKNLLIITGHFPPSASVGALRPLRLVRCIHEFGWQPYVLTLPGKCMFSWDYAVGRDVLSSVPIERVPCWSIWQHSARWRDARPGLPMVAAKAYRALAKILEPLCPVDDLYPWAIVAAGRGAEMVRQHDVQLIWSTTPKPSCSLLAWRISQQTGVPFVVDFRDAKRLPHGEKLCFREKKSLEYERRILQDAAGITFAAPDQRNALREKHPFLADKPDALIYNWFEESEIEACRPRSFQSRTILHGGNLYGGTRRVDGLFKGLQNICRSAQDTGSSLRFLHFGLELDNPYLTALIEEYTLAEQVSIGPSISRNEFLSACLGADILLLVVGHDEGIYQHAHAIPAKLYDYFAACRPILVIGPADCEAGKMVTQLNRGLAVPDDAPDQITEAIFQLLRGHGHHGELDLSLSAVQEFESSSAVKKMAEFFGQILS